MFNALYKKALLAAVAAASLTITAQAATAAAPQQPTAPAAAAATTGVTANATTNAAADKKWHSIYTGKTAKFRTLTGAAVLTIVIAALAKRHLLNTDTDKNLIAFFSTDANGLSFWDRLSANANGERIKFLEILIVAGLITVSGYEVITQGRDWRKEVNAANAASK
ncbi:MAG: hypothetical protein QG632_443 [Candidatus Dependentiae bacterium]|nr:hypothetical protein [Candidatus Dependentiae bacterium]